MNLYAGLKKTVAIHVLISLIMSVLIVYFLNNYIYRISFAFYYSHSYEIVFILLMILGGFGCYVGAFISPKIFTISRYLLMPSLLIASLKLIMNIVTLVVFGTQQESFDVLVSVGFILGVLIFLNSLKVVSRLVREDL